MKPQVIKSSSIQASPFNSIKVQELVSEDVASKMSVAIIELSGVNQKSKNMLSDMFYFILEGSGIFKIDDIEHKVSRGDLIVIPKNTFYFDSGDMKMLSFCSPRFDENNIVYE